MSTSKGELACNNTAGPTAVAAAAAAGGGGEGAQPRLSTLLPVGPTDE